MVERKEERSRRVEIWYLKYARVESLAEIHVTVGQPNECGGCACIVSLVSTAASWMCGVLFFVNVNM